jgi:hypothetical protein
LPHPAKLGVYASFVYGLFWEYMKNTHKRAGHMSTGLQGWQLKTLVALPLARQINRHAATSLKFGRRILKRLHEVEDSIEIIAREMARQAKRLK